MSEPFSGSFDLYPRCINRGKQLQWMMMRRKRRRRMRRTTTMTAKDNDKSDFKRACEQTTVNVLDLEGLVSGT